jgi:hypothetical protein
MLPTRQRRLRNTAFLVLTSLTLPLLAQNTSTQTSARAPYTLRTQVREVLTDITVTDANGNPVTGLPQSDFHVFDDGHPQSIDSFTPHSGNDLAVTTASSHTGTYSNSYLSHPPAA